MRKVATCLALAAASAVAFADQKLGNFIRSMNATSYKQPIHENSASLDGVTHYRLVPGLFPSGMQYHFDGLATVMAFRFVDGALVVDTRYYESDLEKSYSSCLFLGTGTGPTLGIKPCITNPGVNLLPLHDQLWLTIDTAFWGRMDLQNLSTVAAKVDIKSTVLNAHPACDPTTQQCFVQYPCSPEMYPLTNQACVGELVWTNGNMNVTEVSRLTLPANKMIQHSHSPCITPNYVVSKLDSFGSRLKLEDGGLLKFFHQVEDNEWLVHDRRTNTARVLTSNSTSFVNNHFWNCFETEQGIIVDTVAATGDYLDTYFETTLSSPTNWTDMFQPPYRCTVPLEGTQIACEPLFVNPGDASVVFDYPTFSPLVKMQSYEYFYGIAPQSTQSKWFDRLIKVSVNKRAVIADWSAPGVYLTEASYVANPQPVQSEDDGKLLSVIYNATADTSSLAVFDAATLNLVDLYPLDQVIPFHAHGVSCRGNRCFTNP